MDISQITNQDDSPSNLGHNPISINLITSSDEKEHETSLAAKPPVRKVRVKRKRKAKRTLYDYRNDPRFKGQPLEFEIKLEEGGTLVNYAELVKNHLDQIEADENSQEEESEGDSDSSEAIESDILSQDENEVSGDSLIPSSPVSGEEGIQDEFLLRLLRNSKQGKYVSF